MNGNHGRGYRLLLGRRYFEKKLFRRFFNDENIPDDELLHIFFDFSMLSLYITAYDSYIYSTYSKFFDTYSQAKRNRVFYKNFASFIDSFLVHPNDFDVNTCHPFNSSDDRYFFDYEEDEDHIYFWLNVKLNFSRGDIFMDEKTNPTLETTDTSLMPAPIAEVAAEQTNIATLTAEIKMYLHIANQSIIEVGNRLILAKELVPHGEWYSWLKNNFNLSNSMATRFMQIAERFSNRATSHDFDISTFKASTLVALLSLPEGEEEKFIEQKAAEGNPVDDMTVKHLRDEIKNIVKNTTNSRTKHLILKVNCPSQKVR